MRTWLITSLEQVEPWAESYDRLLDKVGGIESLYYALEHLRLPVSIFSSYGIRPFAIFVEEDGEVVAVLPFQIQNDWPFGLWRTIRFIGDVDTQMGNCYPCILADGFCPAAIDAAAALLKTELKDRWDTMDLSGIRPDDENMRYFISRFEEHYEGPSEDEFYYFDATADIDTVLGSKKLANIRRCRKRLEEAYDRVEIRIKDDVSDEDLEEIAALHSRRQSGKKDGDAFFDHKVVGRIVRGMFRLGQGRGHMRYYSLRVDDRPVAVAVVIHTDTVAYGFLTAFDPEFKAYSPSRILLHDQFHREFEVYGVSRIDTSWGANKLKLDFCSGSHKLYDCEIVGRRLKSRAVHALGHRMDCADAAVRRMLRPLRRAVLQRTVA